MVKRYKLGTSAYRGRKKFYAGSIFRGDESSRVASNDWNVNTQCERGVKQ
jgi:hypothetical protein